MAKKKTYTVVIASSLREVAEIFNTTVEQIMKDNNLTNNRVQKGQKLTIKTVE